MLFFMRVIPLLLCGIIISVNAAEPTTLEVQALGIIKEKCADCHSHAKGKMKGSLALDSLNMAIEGGDSGPALVPGNINKSLIVQAIRYTDEDLQMPPKNKRLTDDQINIIENWIAAGAAWTAKPSNAEAIAGRAARKPGRITDEDRAWWSYQPLSQVTPPQTDSTWVINDIDNFIAAGHAKAGLSPAPSADKAALIRRVSYAIIGLPPSPQEVADFINDNSPDAYEQLVDRLLARPEYGEHWARYWLDLVRYADSDGFRADNYRPDAWRYRDYVINSFNADKPYDRFVQEQLAGDELFPNDPQALLATGFLRHWIYEYNNRDVVGQRENILIDITDTTADVFMGVGLQCARCHDHKFDPLLQKDYYRLQAFFTPLIPRDDLVAATTQEKITYAQELAAWESKTKEIRARIDALEAPARQRGKQKALKMFSEELQALYAKPQQERTPQENVYANLIHEQIKYEWSRLMNHVSSDDKPTLIAAQQELTKAEKTKPKDLPTAFVASDIGPEAPPTYIPKKERLGAIEPGFLTILDPDPASLPKPSATSTNRRSALAAWLTTTNQPITTRVIVNRIWQYHFGKGLAINSSDFGQLGEPPSHPQLLDWLARQFITDGWSLKALHRRIVLSATYRQSAFHPHHDALTIKDPENRFLWRGSTRRLQAEAIRDTILSISGELDATNKGGPGVDGSKPKRSIYVKVIRNRRDAVLDVFDVAEGFTSTASRNVTTTPKQSLLMFNSDWAFARARAFANRILKEIPNDEQKRLRYAYQLAVGREPTTQEIQRIQKFIKERSALNNAGSGQKLSLIAEKLPFRDGRSAVLAPGTTQDRLMVGDRDPLPNGDFTIEAFVLLRAPYPSGEVRTIAARWDGSVAHAGWSLGVTGEKSRYKPMTLIMQLCSGDKKAKEAEPLFSGLMLQPGRPYFVAASISLADPDNLKINFHTKDLSNDDEQIQSATVTHHMANNPTFTAPFTIGGRWGERRHLWDGLIDDIRLSEGTMPSEQLLLTSETLLDNTVGYWRFESASGSFSDSSHHGHHLLPLTVSTGEHNAQLEAWVDLCHVLLNMNEVLYVD